MTASRHRRLARTGGTERSAPPSPSAPCPLPVSVGIQILAPPFPRDRLPILELPGNPGRSDLVADDGARFGLWGRADAGPSTGQKQESLRETREYTRVMIMGLTWRVVWAGQDG
jgi:hypothetical protein